jgi:hypothetical protein
MGDKFTAVRWVAVLVYFVGLMFVFVTKNVRMQLSFNIAASLLICFDIFVLAPRPTLSLLGAGVSVKPRFRPGAKVWTGFALLLGGMMCLSHIRMSAFLTMLGLCLLVLDRYRKTSPVSS